MCLFIQTMPNSFGMLGDSYIVNGVFHRVAKEVFIDREEINVVYGAFWVFDIDVGRFFNDRTSYFDIFVRDSEQITEQK